MRLNSRLLVALLLVIAGLAVTGEPAATLAAEPDRWEPLSGPPGVRAASRDPHEPSTIYAITPSSGSSGGLANGARQPLFRSTDRGGTWTVLPGPTEVQTETLRQILLDRRLPGRIYVVAMNSPQAAIIRSDDAGQTWSQMPAPLSVYDQVTVDPFRAGGGFVATSIGISRTTDGFRSVFPAGAGLPMTTTGYLVAPSKRTAGVVYAAGLEKVSVEICAGQTTALGAPFCYVYSYRIHLFGSTDDGSTFAEFGQPSAPISTPLPATLSSLTVDADAEETLYLNRTAGTNLPQTLYRISAGGTIWSIVGSGATKGERVREVFRVQRTSAFPNVAVAIDRSVDGGDTWSPILSVDQLRSLHLTRLLGAETSAALQILSDPANSDDILVVSPSGVLRTIDGGATWTTTTVGLRGGSPRHIVAEPAAPYRIFTSGSEMPNLTGSRGGTTWLIDQVADARFSPDYASDHTAVAEIADALTCYGCTPAFVLTRDGFVSLTPITGVTHLPVFSPNFGEDHVI